MADYLDSILNGDFGPVGASKEDASQTQTERPSRPTVRKFKMAGAVAFTKQLPFNKTFDIAPKPIDLAANEWLKYRQKLAWGSADAKDPTISRGAMFETSKVEMAKRRMSSPEWQDKFESAKEAWEAQNAVIMANRVQAKEQLKAAYEKASPQTRAMLPIELRQSIDMELSGANARAKAEAVRNTAGTLNAPATSTSDVANRMSAMTAANQASLALWAAKPAVSPEKNRVSPIRGGSWFALPGEVDRRAAASSGRELSAWNTAAKTVEEQRRKLLSRAIKQPDEEE